MIQYFESTRIFYNFLRILYGLCLKIKGSVKMPNYMKANMYFHFQKCTYTATIPKQRLEYFWNCISTILVGSFPSSFTNQTRNKGIKKRLKQFYFY